MGGGARLIQLDMPGMSKADTILETLKAECLGAGSVGVLCNMGRGIDSSLESTEGAYPVGDLVL